MTSRILFVAAAAGTAALAAPAAAQYQQPYPYPQYQYPQTYPQQYGQPYQNYGYGQTYGQDYTQNPIGAIIDQLLGNRYSVTDRQAVRQCASAAMAQAGAQYGGYGYRNEAYGGGLRVTSITDVQRRYNGLRVRGLMSTGYGGQYGYQNGYNDRAYGMQQVSFRCDVDYRGAVTNVRIGGNRYRGY